MVKDTVTKVCWLLQAQNKTHCANMFMMVLNDELVEKLVHERNRTKKIQARTLNPSCSRMRDWTPVTIDDTR
jgi:predicted site-specific integrase-resolvase